MARGKQTCKILKEIRRQIAEANDIEFITSECQYQGDCLGTCPKCEAEVRYLEQQLERKQIAGKAITVLGISAGLIAMTPVTSCTNSTNKGMNKEVSSDITSYENLIMGEPVPISAEDTIIASIKDVPPPPKTMPIPDSVIEGEICENPPEIGGIIIPPRDTLDVSPLANDTLKVAPVMPEFPGGQQALMQFLAKKIQYPTVAQGDMGVGRVIIQFIVDKEGYIIKPRVVRSVDPYLDKEALRVINQMPKWKPGELEDGTKVAVYFTVPVMFRAQ